MQETRDFHSSENLSCYKNSWYYWNITILPQHMTFLIHSSSASIPMLPKMALISLSEGLSFPSHTIMFYFVCELCAYFTQIGFIYPFTNWNLIKREIKAGTDFKMVSYNIEFNRRAISTSSWCNLRPCDITI